MREVLIDRLQNNEFDEVSEILVDAFQTNPAYSIIFKKKEYLKEGLLWLFKASLLMNNHKQTLTRVIKEKETGRIIGTFTLIPPQGIKNGIFVYLKMGIPSFISKFGLKSLMRMVSLDKLNKSSLTDAMQASRYYYLSMVVIKEEYRGTGIGSYAIKTMMKELNFSTSSSELIGLTTQLPENVVFYSRLGFEKIDEGYIDFEGERYYNYNMKFELN